MNALTVSEQGRLTEMETIIDHGLQTFYEVGKALTAIRDEQLYRVGYATFEDYCEEKWQMSRAYAYRTIGAADVVKSLSPIGDKPLPANEAQARPLTSLEPGQRQQAWTKAVEESGGKPTARQVQAAADEVSGKFRNLAEGIQANYNNQADLKFSIRRAHALMNREIDENTTIEPDPQPATEPIAAAVLNSEQTEPRKAYAPCANCGRELTGPGWTSDLGGNVCDACAGEHSRHAQLAPKPRIASFVMGYFQAANEAIARITTAIPKARTDDIHDMMTIIASLERMERRVGSEYDMS